jgi:hypothetical protein
MDLYVNITTEECLLMYYVTLFPSKYTAYNYNVSRDANMYFMYITDREIKLESGLLKMS